MKDLIGPALSEGASSKELLFRFRSASIRFFEAFIFSPSSEGSERTPSVSSHTRTGMRLLRNSLYSQDTELSAALNPSLTIFVDKRSVASFGSCLMIEESFAVANGTLHTPNGVSGQS